MFRKRQNEWIKEGWKEEGSSHPEGIPHPEHRLRLNEGLALAVDILHIDEDRARVDEVEVVAHVTSS